MTDFESYAQAVRAALTERRALAQAATSGRWKHYPDESPEFGVVAVNFTSTFPTGVGGAMRFYDAAFIAANDPAHVLELIDKQETAVALAVEGLRRHQRTWVGRCATCHLLAHEARVDWPCPDALAWWSVLTGIGEPYGVTPEVGT